LSGTMNPLHHPPARRVLLLLALLSVGLLLPGASGQQGGKDKGKGPDKKGPAPEAKAEGTLPDNVVRSFQWRGTAPANVPARITALAVYEADPSTYWVATASGGLLKTTNHGVTFEHQFDHEATVSIGDVCVAPSNRDIVWVGTGEANPRNSVSYGDG